jgi:serine phosphatase RsbU (regulator of sigma subunit)
MDGLSAPPVAVGDSPKHAFRTAESSIASIEFRSPIEGIERACERIRELLATLGVVADSAIYLPDRIEHRRAAGNTAFPELLSDVDRRSISTDVVSYDTDAAPARAVWRLEGFCETVVVWRFALPIRSDLVVVLEAFRLVVSQRLLEASFSGVLEQAAAIQRSLLPDPLPPFPGFDLAARSVPAETVGGDVYDVLPLASDALAFAIADVSGHGLPAALEARDVLVGLRMGAARHMKIDATVEKLNTILCRSTLSTRFVSLVYGELESDGRFQFVNAGHPQPVLVNPEGIHGFPETGLVLGVSQSVRHRVRHGGIEPGGVIVLVTDGILETRSPSGEEFGASRVAFLVRALRQKPAAWIVSALFEALIDHSREMNPVDDATVLVIKREE